MKKALDQTVRELKREVNKKVLKVPGIEQKILDATSNEPWGPHGSHLADIAQATQNYHEYQMIMSVIWKRISDTGKNWRHVYKALTVLDYLVAHGSERVIDEIREHVYQISTLSDFQYIDSAGRDQGSNVRRKSQTLVALVTDKERIQEVRQKAAANRDKYRSTNLTGGAYRPGMSPGNGGYGDRYDDGRFESRYGSRDEDRNGYGREKNWGNKDDDKYGRIGDSYNRDGDKSGRDSDERYERDSYQDDDYKGNRGSDDQFGSRNKSIDRDRDRSDDDEYRYASRGSGGVRDDEVFQGDRRPSEQNVGAPPSYEHSTRDSPNYVRNDKDGGGGAANEPKTLSPPAYKAGTSESTSRGVNHVTNVSASAQNKEVDDFDAFDPRGSVAAMPPASSTSHADLSGTEASDPINFLALVPVTSFTSNSEADMPTNSGYGTTFAALSSVPSSLNQPSEDPFGETPFKATSHGSMPAQQQSFGPPTSFQPSLGSTVGVEALPPVALQIESSPSFDFEDPLGGLTYTPVVTSGQHSSANYSYVSNGQQSSANPAFLTPELLTTQMSSDVLGAPPPQAGALPSVFQYGAQSVAQTNLMTTNMNYHQQPIAAQPLAPANFPTAHMNLTQQPVPLASHEPLTTTTAGLAPPAQDRFETKSTVWTDTLSRGLVNLNISGHKTNPMADIGVDFESINRMEKRKQDRSSATPAAASTIKMGKAMGAGSGVSRAGPPNPPMIGSSMNQQPMGMGRGMNTMGMGMGMNMNMGTMSQGAPMRPPTGMPLGPGIPGVGYNPMMGMSNYGSQQQSYGGGYR